MIESIRQNPWSKSGKTLFSEGTTNPQVAIQQAGLDWNADKVRLRCADTLDAVGDYCAIRRSDNGNVLSVVGKDFCPFQNTAMFQVFNDLAHARGNVVTPFKIETAGSFQGGKIVWALCDLPALGIIIGDDHIKTYLLVSNGHNGKKTLTIAPTTIRVICQNTLAMAEAQARGERRKGKLSGGFAVKHTPGLIGAVEEVKEIYNQTIRNRFATDDAFKHLAKVQLTQKLEREFMASVFGVSGPSESERSKTIRKHRDERIAAILASPTSQVKGTKDSGFSLLNAITEYIDHDRTTRTSEEGSTDEARLMSSVMGSGAALKERAWDSMLELVG